MPKAKPIPEGPPHPVTRPATFPELCAMTEVEARTYLEAVRWPSGPACVHCGSVDVKRLGGAAAARGVLKCKDCRKQFTVTVGTVFHGSHIPLKKWLMAFHIVCASKKSVSAHQLHRQMKVTYKTAWFLAHRIRHALSHDPLSDGPLEGVVEVDETYIGGKPRKANRAADRKKRRGKGPGGTEKAPVMVLVERGGRVKAAHVQAASSVAAARLIGKNVHPLARLHTDESRIYDNIGRKWKGGHETVEHAREYVAEPRPGHKVHINTAECFNGLFKRSLTGAWHHISHHHLQRYADEVQFRWNYRDMTDEQRTVMGLRQGDGVRLAYSTWAHAPA